MIDRKHRLSVTRQATLLGLSRGSVYYLPQPVGAAALALMRRLDELHLEHPFMGARMLRRQLLAAGIRAEEEVIVPPYTFFSTASAVIEANAVPVFADIDLETFNLDPSAVEKSITARTRAISPGGTRATLIVCWFRS